MREDAPRASRVCAQAREVTRRARHAVGRKRVLALVAGTGDANFGDDWMAAKVREQLPSWQVVELLHPVVEMRLSRLGLSGEHLFGGVLVSGGTLFNEYFYKRARPLLRVGLPSWSAGTGAGSPGLGITDADAGSHVWAEELQQFTRVTVRGPLSAALLASAGVTRVEPIGDLAMLYAEDLPVSSDGDRCDRILVNVAGITHPARLHDARHVVLHGLADGIELIRAAGLKPIPFALHRSDLDDLRALGGLIGGWAEPPLMATAATWSPTLLTNVRAIIGTRLHASALGWIYGRAVIALGYRAKVQDLALQVGAEADVIDLDSADSRLISEAIAELPQRDPERARGIHRRVVACRNRQREFLAEIEKAAGART